MIALLLVRRRAVNNSADLSEKKKSKKVFAFGTFRSILFLPFFSFCYRRCGSVKVKLVLNFSMELNSVYTIQNYKVFIRYFYRKIAVCQTRRFNPQRRFSPLKFFISGGTHVRTRTCVYGRYAPEPVQ